jgi:hypothetical protein
VIPPLTGGQEYQTVIDDSAHATSKGLTATQWSASVADPGFRDFVVITYRIDNFGSEPLNGVYAGIFSDFDINNTTSNDVYTDTLRRFTYMTQSWDYTYAAGIKLLSPQTAANLSAIDHNVYIRPSGMITEAVKDSFLRGAITRSNSNGSRNWSCVVSAGPFDLEVRGRAFVAFAFVGGNTEAELLEHADSAQSWFDRSVAVKGEANAGDIAQVTLRATPSPVRDRAELHFALPQDGRVRLSVLDVSGRVVRVLADGFYRRGAYTSTWDGRDATGGVASNGVFVYRLETAAGTINRKAVVLR